VPMSLHRRPADPALERAKIIDGNHPAKPAAAARRPRSHRLAEGHLVGRRVIKDLQVDPQLPFFVKWLSDPALHPSVDGRQIELLKIELAGNPSRVNEWLGGRFENVLRDVDVEWTRPNGHVGLVSALFSTPRGEVSL
jgi:hypothetical protein